MDKNKIKSLYNEKIELIKKLNKQYYEKNKPIVPIVNMMNSKKK